MTMLSYFTVYHILRGHPVGASTTATANPHAENPHDKEFWVKRFEDFPLSGEKPAR